MNEPLHHDAFTTASLLLRHRIGFRLFLFTFTSLQLFFTLNTSVASQFAVGRSCGVYSFLAGVHLLVISSPFSFPRTSQHLRQQARLGCHQHLPFQSSHLLHLHRQIILFFCLASESICSICVCISATPSRSCLLRYFSLRSPAWKGITYSKY